MRKDNLSFHLLTLSTSVSHLCFTGCDFPTRPLSSGPPRFFFLSSAAAPVPPLRHAHTDTATHPLVISEQAEPMKVNNCPLSWKCPLLLRWSGVAVCIQSKHHHSPIPTCGDLRVSAARLKRKSPWRGRERLDLGLVTDL